MVKSIDNKLDVLKVGIETMDGYFTNEDTISWDIAEVKREGAHDVYTIQFSVFEKVN